MANYRLGEPFDPTAKPRYNVAIRLNDYQLAMLRYLAEARDISQHKLLQRHLIPILKQLALEALRRSGLSQVDLT